MKKLFIFKPSETWSYCGGGRAVIADNWYEAVAYFPDDIFGVTEKEIEKINEERNWDKWVLVATYGLEGDPPKGIVLDDHNWA